MFITEVEGHEIFIEQQQLIPDGLIDDVTRLAVFPPGRDADMGVPYFPGDPCEGELVVVYGEVFLYSPPLGPGSPVGGREQVFGVVVPDCVPEGGDGEDGHEDGDEDEESGVGGYGAS